MIKRDQIILIIGLIILTIGSICTIANIISTDCIIIYGIMYITAQNSVLLNLFGQRGVIVHIEDKEREP